MLIFPNTIFKRFREVVSFFSVETGIITLVW